MSRVEATAVRRRVIAVLSGALAPLCVRVAQAHSSVVTAPSDRAGDAALVGTVIAVAAVAYCVGLHRIWQRATRGHRDLLIHGLGFAGGLAAVALALLSPLDRWGTELFALHMVQHEVLMLIAAPLLVLGRPLPVFLWAFSGRSRTWVAQVSHAHSVQVVWAAMLTPMVAWLLHALVLWIWHAPPLFEAALRNGTVHDIQHVSFLASALVFWAAMIETRKQTQQGAVIIYLFTTTVHTSVLGALITFAARPWYAAYMQTPRNWGLSALEDQQLGGLIMWVPGSLVYVAIALVLLVRWIRASAGTDWSSLEPKHPEPPSS